MHDFFIFKYDKYTLLLIIQITVGFVISYFIEAPVTNNHFACIAQKIYNFKAFYVA